MNDILKSKLAVLADDELMLKALETLVAERIAKIKPDINKTDDDRMLGQKYRASKEAEKIIKGSLEDISSYKMKRSDNKPINKGK